MKTFWGGLMLAASAVLPAAEALAQAAPRDTLVWLREIDADRYDPPRSAATAAGEAIFLLSDTLVSMDWDQRTVRPGLAERWEVSEDGKTYTFHLKRNVTFCDGKPMTARDVAYTINRWVDPATRSPVRYRAGQVESVTAADDYTVVYKLKEPYSELLYQLTQQFSAIVDQATVEKLGENFGVQGFNGTGPYCWQSWTPRQDMVLTKHPNYNWGPPIYQNPSPQVGRIVLRIIPEANTRLAAIQSGQADVVAGPALPAFAIEGLRRVPTVKLQQQSVFFYDIFVGFKVDKPVASDAAIRRAANLAVNKEAISRAVFFGTAPAAPELINPQALDYDAQAGRMVPRFNQDEAKKVLDEAGWVPGPDGIRVKDGQRATLLAYGLQNQANNGMMQAMQADLRRVGIELRVQLWDATVGWGKLATQEYDVFTMSYPYVSATDALSLYFPSGNRPTPNRMNWADPETDALLDAAKRATDPAARAEAIGKLQRKLAEANVWVPMIRTSMWMATSQRVEGARPHGIYGVALYKGLDIRLTR
ncbi:ABC transporter substrate-binding protein [Roseomonas populi]|uniref:ABC transporter substrate-binding protein n=1 Tax=Roseomonas populi TaxID=3121582 RepID=A0ABT1X9A4_9PROT|nr:ABC transporter substrate-binding protein [Roseomonas pecuniae]MCR0984346.1 ABC transporter substrate-binding protein [Roseomonas pecuniae]